MHGVAQSERAGARGERVTIHRGGAGLGEQPRIDLGRALHQQLRDDEVEHGVAQELEPLVVAAPLLSLPSAPGRSRWALRTRAVGQGLDQVVAVREAIPEARLEVRERGLVRRSQ